MSQWGCLICQYVPLLPSYFVTPSQEPWDCITQQVFKFTREILFLLADGQRVGGAVGRAVGGAVVGTIGGGSVPPQAGIVAGVHSPAVEQEAYRVCSSRFAV